MIAGRRGTAADDALVTTEPPMRLCLIEDEQVAFLEPLALTRPAFDLRCGARTLGERQRAYFGVLEWAAMVRPHLAELCRLEHPDAPVNDPAWLRAGPAIVVNARWLPGDQAPPDSTTPRMAMVADQWAYAVVPAE